MQDLKKILADRLKGKLPGMDSHMKMVPEPRRAEIEGFHNGQDALKAAVLICFVNNSDKGAGIVLIRRNEYDGVHSGQISFPGGRYEQGDAGMVGTALREAEEEINIKGNDVEVLGEISPVFIPPSNFFVTPVVAWSRKQPDLIPDPMEVSEILTISLHELMDPASRQVRNIPHREFKQMDVPCFYLRGNIVWGATAMMLMELIDILET